MSGPYEPDPRVKQVRERLHAAREASGAPTPKAAEKLAGQNKLYVRERIAAYAESGVTHLNVIPIPTGEQTVASVVSQVKEWAS